MSTPVHNKPRLCYNNNSFVMGTLLPSDRLRDQVANEVGVGARAPIATFNIWYEAAGLPIYHSLPVG